MQHDNDRGTDKQLEDAYDSLMRRVLEAFERAGEGRISLRHALEQAREATVTEAGLTEEQAQRVSEWVQRDLQDAGDYLAHRGHELRDWLYMDLELIEYSLFDLFAKAADQTKLALLQFEEQARHAGELHAGEVTGPGTLECKSCGELLHFKERGHIPPCPRCHASVFVRKTTESD